jgi:hypothetical protein
MVTRSGHSPQHAQILFPPFSSRRNTTRFLRPVFICIWSLDVKIVANIKLDLHSFRASHSCIGIGTTDLLYFYSTSNSFRARHAFTTAHLLGRALLLFYFSKRVSGIFHHHRLDCPPFFFLLIGGRPSIAVVLLACAGYISRAYSDLYG